jgi:hypothetical protein
MPPDQGGRVFHKRSHRFGTVDSAEYRGEQRVVGSQFSAMSFPSVFVGPRSPLTLQRRGKKKWKSVGETVGLGDGTGADLIVNEIAAGSERLAIDFEQRGVFDLGLDDAHGGIGRQCLSFLEQGS